jgi:hypothetical protein
MELLSEEKNDNQYYVSLLDAPIKENNLELKHRLQKLDTYAQFINEQARLLLDSINEYSAKNEVSFLEASSFCIEVWKKRMFS